MASERLSMERAAAHRYVKQGRIRDFVYVKRGSIIPFHIPGYRDSELDEVDNIFDATWDYPRALDGVLRMVGLKAPSTQTSPLQPIVFICYRRRDSGGYALHLYSDLVSNFGEDRVFMDLAGIDPGVDFTARLEEAVQSCGVLLAVIGRDWLTITDPDTGRRRLDDPKDRLRIEISSALQLGKQVIPVIVGGATIPPAEALPEDLRPLSGRQKHDTLDSHWKYDVDKLIEFLERTFKPMRAPKPTESQLERPKGQRQPKIKIGSLVRQRVAPPSEDAEGLTLSQQGVVVSISGDQAAVSWYVSDGAQGIRLLEPVWVDICGLVLVIRGPLA